MVVVLKKTALFGLLLSMRLCAMQDVSSVPLVPVQPAHAQVLHITPQLIEYSCAQACQIVGAKRVRRRALLSLAVVAGSAFVLWNYAPNCCMPNFINRLREPVQQVPPAQPVPAANIAPAVPAMPPAHPVGFWANARAQVSDVVSSSLHAVHSGVNLCITGVVATSIGSMALRAWRSCDDVWAFNEYASIWPSIDALLYTCAAFDAHSPVFGLIKRLEVYGNVQTLDPQDMMMLQTIGGLSNFVGGQWQMCAGGATGPLIDKLVRLNITASGADQLQLNADQLVYAFNDYVIRLNLCLGYLKSKSEALSVSGSRRARIRQFVEACVQDVNRFADLVETVVNTVRNGERPAASCGLLSTCLYQTNQVSDMFTRLTNDPEISVQKAS